MAQLRSAVCMPYADGTLPFQLNHASYCKVYCKSADYVNWHAVALGGSRDDSYTSFEVTESLGAFVPLLSGNERSVRTACGQAAIPLDL
jgi:hypothetical protein